jgi:hypothetical protein
MKNNILKKLKDLAKQAETEKSHYYTATTLKAAILEIKRLRRIERLFNALREV